MLIKFTNSNIRFRKISEEDFTAIGFDGQGALNMDTHVMPFIELPDPVAQWLLDNEPKDWEKVETDTSATVPPRPAPVPPPPLPKPDTAASVAVVSTTE